MGKKKNGLTFKQNAFCDAVASGKHDSLAAAYDACYKSSGNISTSRREASRLIANPTITTQINERVERMRVENEQRNIATSVSDRELILESLREWIRTAVPADSAKQRAAELLAKITGMLTDKVEISQVERTPADVVAEIERRLSALPGNSDKNTPEVPEIPENTLIN